MQQKIQTKTKLEDTSINAQGGKSHECTVCGKRVALKRHLKRHLMVHTWEKPHLCTICKKGFTQKSSLKKHLSTHCT